jgi:hypothetical protein
MSDPNIDEFYGRVARIERAHANGQSFVAVGTLGRPEPRRSSRVWPIARSLIFVALLITLFKAALLHQIGEGAYGAKVASLWTGGAIDRLGAALMTADPLTVWVARQLGQAATLI